MSALILTPGHLADLAFMSQVRNAGSTELRMMLRWQSCEAWRAEHIGREIKRREDRRTRPVVRALLALAPVLRFNVRPARFAIAPPVKVLGAHRVTCCECGVAIRATGKGPVTRRGDGWRCWRCCK